jgi:hypothetical protein
MPSVIVKTEFPDGQVTLVQVRGKLTYPQALHDLKAVALEAFDEAIATTRVVEDDEAT